MVTSSCLCHLKYSVYLYGFGTFQKHVILQLIHIYINNTCEDFHVTDECLRVVFVFSNPV